MVQIARSNPPNLMDVYEMNGGGNSMAFSICYAQYDGYLTVGGHNAIFHDPSEQVQYVTYHDEYHQYRVVLQSIKV